MSMDFGQFERLKNKLEDVVRTGEPCTFATVDEDAEPFTVDSDTAQQLLELIKNNELQTPASIWNKARELADTTVDALEELEATSDE